MLFVVCNPHPCVSNINVNESYTSCHFI